VCIEMGGEYPSPFGRSLRDLPGGDPPGGRGGPRFWEPAMPSSSRSSSANGRASGGASGSAKSRARVRFDAIDLAILDQLQRDSKITNAMLAQRIGISP